MLLKPILFKNIYLYTILLLLVSCNSEYALKNSENFKDVKGYMIYSYSSSDFSHMELRLRNLNTGEDEVLINSTKSGYSKLFPISATADGHLIFVQAEKKYTKDTFMLLYNLKEKSFKELNINHSALAGDISPDKSKLLFSFDPNGQLDFNIYISDLNGKNLQKLDCPATSCWHPSWNEDGTKIVYIADGRKIYEYSALTKKHNLLYSFYARSSYTISYPIYYKNSVYFNKRRAKPMHSNKINTEILKLSNKKTSVFFESRDSFVTFSFLSDSLIINAAGNQKFYNSKRYYKIRIYDTEQDNSFSLTTSDVKESWSSSPLYILNSKYII